MWGFTHTHLQRFEGWKILKHSDRQEGEVVDTHEPLDIVGMPPGDGGRYVGEERLLSRLAGICMTERTRRHPDITFDCLAVVTQRGPFDELCEITA